MARRMKGGNQGAAIFSILVVIAALAVSLYFYFRPINSAGKEIAFWCSIVFGATLLSVVVVQCCDKYIDND